MQWAGPLDKNEKPTPAQTLLFLPRKLTFTLEQSGTSPVTSDLSLSEPGLQQQHSMKRGWVKNPASWPLFLLSVEKAVQYALEEHRMAAVF